MDEPAFDHVAFNAAFARPAEERSVSDILADAQRELERADDLLVSYLRFVCDRRTAG